jgi:hypothetical protein
MSEVRQELVLWQAYCEKKMALEDAQDEIEKLRAALRSIAANTCCNRCQEAALVARAALGEKG